MSFVELEQVRFVLQGYCQALAGPQARVVPCAELVGKNIGWAREAPTSDGITVYLPAAVAGAGEDDGFSWYKAMAAHQVGHIEWGSYEFRFDRPAAVFDNLRPRLSPSTRSPSDYGRFFGAFSHEQLARDLFAIAEDCRVDHRVVGSYPGLAPFYLHAQRRCLATRPPTGALSARSAVVEALLRLTLGREDGGVAAVREASCILRELRRPEATVEDAAEATIRIYPLVVGVAGDYVSPAGVLYRGDFKPEVGQLLADATTGGQAPGGGGPGTPLSREQIEDLLQTSPEIEIAPGELPAPMREQAVVDNLHEELAGRSPPSDDGDEGDGGGDDEGDDVSLEPTEPGTFAYPEWDAGRMRHKKGFCLVHERGLAFDKNSYYEDTLTRRAALAHEIRRRFEAVACQMLRKEKRQSDGEELDLDAVVDALIDRRAGHCPTDRLYSRRNKTERSVAVAFLLDMSASTADPVDGRPGPAADGQRIVDLEKEALVLLTHALSALGDAYGVYGFSGYGRKCVDFYVVKDLRERLSSEVIQRVDAIEPHNATRMGPAIRHATTKLLGYRARSRYLFLITDGRPQDRGYGSPGESRQYAVHDTRAALLEARGQGITPFCLAVDKQGHDYLGGMMQGMRYEVLWDVAMLPRKLPELYRVLTT